MAENTTTMEFSKSVDDIEEPVPIPEDWYVFLIATAPQIKPNQKKRDGLTYEDGAADNLVVNLRTISDEPEYNGRGMTIWLPYPCPEDEEAFNRDGMKKYDEKFQRLALFAETAKGCDIEGSTINIRANGRIGLYVTQAISRSDPNKLENNIDIWSGFKDPDEIGVPLDLDGSL